jgi:hypothetical protein
MTSTDEEDTETEEGEFSKTAYKRRWKPGQRQRRSRGSTRTKRKNYNRKNKGKRRLYAKKWRKKNKNKGAFKQSQKRRNKSNRRRRGFVELSAQRVADMYKELEFAVLPQDVEAETDEEEGRVASVLTVPEISFGIGPEMTLGVVDSISPMSGMVTFRLTGPGVPPLDSMEVPTFLRLAAFLTEDDMDAFFNLVDVELGEDAYGDLDEEGLRDCAAMYDMDMDEDEFKMRCVDLVGSSNFEGMAPGDFDTINEMVVGLMGSEFPRSQESATEGDDSISEAYDPHLYYGEVDSAEG